MVYTDIGEEMLQHSFDGKFDLINLEIESARVLYFFLLLLSLL